MSQFWDTHSPECSDCKSYEKELSRANKALGELRNERDRLHLALKKIAEVHDGVGRFATRALGEEIQFDLSAPERCEICGWPLVDSSDQGCVKDNCSYRAPEGTPEYFRIRNRREEVRREAAALVRAERDRATWSTSENLGITEELRQERDRLRKALEFYADEAHWNGFPHPDNPRNTDVLQVVGQNGWDQARLALDGKEVVVPAELESATSTVSR